jgi:hypothetical protein
MKRLGMKGLLVALSLASMCSSMAIAGEGQSRNLVQEAEKLRAQAYEQAVAGNSAAALASLSACGDILQMKEYTDSNKSMMVTMMSTQLSQLQRDAYKKRDWAGTENVLRKKIAFLESMNKADTNDYQSSLRTLEIVLKAQGKSTETETLKKKMRPLVGSEDKPTKLEPIGEPPPPAKE